MRNKLNQLIKKYIDYVPIILKLNFEEINVLYNMTEEDAIKKLQRLKMIKLCELEKITNEQCLFYSNY